MKKARTPMLKMLQQAYKLAFASKQTGISAEEIVKMGPEAWSRRRFIESAGKTALVLGAASMIPGCRPEELLPTETTDEGELLMPCNAQDVRIAIIGAGLAGLNALHVFKKAGINNVTVFEGSNRIGGRTMSVDNVMASGLTTDYGGEFVDSIHEEMLVLADELGLTLLDTEAPSELSLTKDAYYFNGQHYTLAQVVAQFELVVDAIQSDYDNTSDEITYQHATAFDKQLDNTSISDYLSDLGVTGWFKEFIEVAYETEYGLSCDVQSSINFIWLVGLDTQGGTAFDVFGASDERYKIAGGTQQISTILAGMYSNHIEKNRKLNAIDRVGGEYKLYLQGYGNPQTFDYVVMTIPFTKLRQVDIMFNLPNWKKKSIEELSYGTNAKLMMGFTDRHWRGLGYAGYYFTDNGAQSGWDNSQLQGGTAGGFTVFTGGQIGVNLGTGSVASKVSQFLPKLEQLYPGITAKYNGNAARMHWPTHTWALGSYPCYKVGDYHKIGDAERRKVQRLYFAGDHCNLDYQGYMNAAALTGREAAEGIIADLA